MAPGQRTASPLVGLRLCRLRPAADASTGYAQSAVQTARRVAQAPALRSCASTVSMIHTAPLAAAASPAPAAGAPAPRQLRLRACSVDTEILVSPVVANISPAQYMSHVQSDFAVACSPRPTVRHAPCLPTVVRCLWRQALTGGQVEPPAHRFALVKYCTGLYLPLGHPPCLFFNQDGRVRRQHNQPCPLLRRHLRHQPSPCLPPRLRAAAPLLANVYVHAVMSSSDCSVPSLLAPSLAVRPPMSPFSSLSLHVAAHKIKIIPSTCKGASFLPSLLLLLLRIFNPPAPS